MMKYSKEAKQAFFDAFLTYRNAGETFVGAYSRARADFNAAHRLAPNLWTFRKWYSAAMNGKKDQQTEEAAETAPEETAAETETAEAAEEIPEEGSAEPEAEEVPDEVLAQDEEAAQPADDYTARLEMVCRMYRTHSEESRDAICDYLLPDLCKEGAEE